jgi:Tol biopolymer transport system component
LAAGSPQADAVRAQLIRILASEVFSRSDRLTAFLTYIVEHTLAGDGAALKEHVLAMEVYGKAANFDTGLDPIVRVDARRLRDKLREYYASAPHDAIVISVPKGSYAPAFETNGHATAIAIDAIGPAATSQSRVWPVRAAMVVLGVCASLALAIVWRSLAAKPPPLRLLTVTSFPGAEGMPSLSPDGNFVVFTWRGIDPTEAADVWVKAVDGDELRRLTNTPQFHEAMPAWSPDGRQIAYYRLEGMQNRGVFLVSPLGGPERKVADESGSPAWTPDGQSLVMAGATADGPGIFQQVLETGARKRLTQSPAGFFDDFPKVSPDGRTIAFARIKLPQSALFVVPMAGGEPTRLTEWGGDIGRLDWTPDGREILYPQLDTSGMRIFRIAATAGQTPAPVAGLPIGVNMLSVSRPRAGQTYRVALGYGQPDIGLRLVDLESATQAGVFATVTPFCDSTRVDMPGRFSKDGRRVAFESDRNGDAQIWVAGRDGSDLRSVTSPKTSFVNVGSWSPDGRFVAVEGIANGNSDIYVISADGSPPRRLTDGRALDNDPEWSRDGIWIYYGSNASGRAEIWKIPAAGGTPVRLTTGGGFEPRESPDGRTIYYVDARVGNGLARTATLKQIPSAGGAETVVLSGVPPGAWDLTDRGVVFVTGSAGVRSTTPGTDDALDLYSFADRRVHRLGVLPFPVARYGVRRLLTVSGDGRWALAAQIDRWDRDILVADNFR